MTTSQSAVDDPIALRKEMGPYQHPSKALSIWQLINTLIPLAGSWAVSWFALQVSFWLALPPIVLTAGFLVRTFIIFHDCGHQAFFASRRANTIWGYITGILAFTPFHYWHHDHAIHHAGSGNLDKRGHGDIWLMTVAEYQASSRFMKLYYRLYRNPLVMFLIGPLMLIFVYNRFPSKKANRNDIRSIVITNVAFAAIVVGLGMLCGFRETFIIYGLSLYLASIAGIWLFYVQHHFEDVYWERTPGWDFATASLEGGSYYRLPKILQWFSGSIGYHHIHHFNARIPNYRLSRCYKAIETLQASRPVTLAGSLRTLGYRLWDESERRLVGFKHLKSPASSR